MAEKNLYIRCDEETYVKARELAQKNLRSLNRQVIHLINEAYDSVVKSEPAIAEPQPIQMKKMISIRMSKEDIMNTETMFLVKS